jgi:hypothetical protein
MPRRVKAYLPPWVRWIIFPMLLLMWGLITYRVFGTGPGREQLGLAGWAVVSLILLLVGIMMWLMSAGRLPAYIVEIDDSEDATQS